MIELATWRDLNQVRYIEKVCFAGDAWPLWDLIGVLTLSNTVRLKATLDGQMVGFIAGDIRPSEKRSWIATVGVLPEFRRRGIGEALILACEKQQPYSSVRLCVRPSNQTAINLYLSLGYKTIGTWPRYYHDGEPALVMEKLLDG